MGLDASRQLHPSRAVRGRRDLHAEAEGPMTGHARGPYPAPDRPGSVANPSWQPFGSLQHAVRTLLRLLVTMAVAAVGVTATAVAVTPQVARLVTSNHIEAPTLPDLGHALTALDHGQRRGRHHRRVRGGQPDPDPLRAGALRRDRRRAGGGGRELLRAQGDQRQEPAQRAVLANVSAGEVRQGGSTITQQLVGLNYLPATPSANDKIVEATYAVRAGEEAHQAADPRALPELRVLRERLLRHPGRRGDVLQQERRPAHDGRGRLPGRAHQGAVGLRPVPLPRPFQGPARAGPQPPGRRPAR